MMLAGRGPRPDDAIEVLDVLGYHRPPLPGRNPDALLVRKRCPGRIVGGSDDIAGSRLESLRYHPWDRHDRRRRKPLNPNPADTCPTEPSLPSRIAPRPPSP